MPYIPRVADGETYHKSLGYAGLVVSLVTDVIDRLTRQLTHFAVQDGPQSKEVRDEQTLQLMRLAGVLGTKVAPNPPYVSHGRVNSLDVELILETDGQAV